MRKKGDLLTYDSWVEVNFIESLTKDDEIDELSEEEREEFIEMAREPDFFKSLVSSVAPQIHGLREIKQAALLMLFGGLIKKRKDFPLEDNQMCCLLVILVWLKVNY